MMRDIDPPGGAPAGRDVNEVPGADERIARRSDMAASVGPVGDKPIVWRWWLAAAVISLGLWGGILLMVT